MYIQYIAYNQQYISTHSKKTKLNREMNTGICLRDGRLRKDSRYIVA